MANFDAAKEWVIIISSEIPQVEKGARDLSRCIGLLAALEGSAASPPPKILKALDPMPSGDVPLIILNCEDRGNENNGFEWRTGNDRVEIFAESWRGLCNGIYSFLSALGISWPAVGQEKLPQRGTLITQTSACEPSNLIENDPVLMNLRRFVPSGKKEINRFLSKAEASVLWAARNRYDALVFPLEVLASKKTGRKLSTIKKIAPEYGIVIEAGGYDLSSLMPRGVFFSHRDFFRMEGGKRKKDHHFCPTNPQALRLIGKVAKKLFLAAGETRTFHLWPDNGAEAAWCFCPTCRAFTAQEQNRMGVNAAADILAAINPDAIVTFYEKPGEDGRIPLRKNIFRMEKLPEETKL